MIAQDESFRELVDANDDESRFLALESMPPRLEMLEKLETRKDTQREVREGIEF